MGCILEVMFNRFTFNFNKYLVVHIIKFRYFTRYKLVVRIAAPYLIDKL